MILEQPPSMREDYWPAMDWQSFYLASLACCHLSPAIQAPFNIVCSKVLSFWTFIWPFVSVPRARFVSFNDIANWVDCWIIAVNCVVHCVYLLHVSISAYHTHCVLFNRQFRHTMQEKNSQTKKDTGDRLKRWQLQWTPMWSHFESRKKCFHFHCTFFYPCLFIELERALPHTLTQRFVSTQFTIRWRWRLFLSNRLDNHAISFGVLRCCGRTHNYPIKSN